MTGLAAEARAVTDLAQIDGAVTAGVRAGAAGRDVRMTIRGAGECAGKYVDLGAKIGAGWGPGCMNKALAQMIMNAPVAMNTPTASRGLRVTIPATLQPAVSAASVFGIRCATRSPASSRAPVRRLRRIPARIGRPPGADNRHRHR